MRAKLYPPLRNQFDISSREKVYCDRVLELFENTGISARESYVEWQRYNLFPSKDIPSEALRKVFKWVSYSSIAREEALEDLLTYEKDQMMFSVEFENL